MSRRTPLAARLALGFLILASCGPLTSPVDPDELRASPIKWAAANAASGGLECFSKTTKALYADLDNVTLGARLDRIGAIKGFIRGLQPDDLVLRFWSRRQKRPFVRVERRERSILIVAFDGDLAGGWSPYAYSWCPEPGNPTPIYA